MDLQYLKSSGYVIFENVTSAISIWGYRLFGKRTIKVSNNGQNMTEMAETVDTIARPYIKLESSSSDS